MIYLIGGAPRTGKTSLAKKLALPFLSTDFLIHMVSDTLPQLKLLEPYSEIAGKFAPYLSNLVKHINSSIKNYTVEGDAFSPAQVAELQKTYPIRACFLGFSKVTLQEIKDHGGENDWLEILSESERENLPEWIIAQSLNLQAECEKVGIAYVDMAAELYADSLERAGGVLMGE